MYIGKKIKELRKVQKMSLSTLAEKSGVQIASLSRMEHLKMIGTLESHMNIAKTLGVEITDLYIDIVKKEEKPEATNPQLPTDVFTYNDESSCDILTTNVLSKKMMPTLLKIEPAGQTTKEKNLGGTEKFVYVLSGKVNVMIGNKPYPLTKNSTLYFNASAEHYFINLGKALTKIICITTPVSL